jgi:cytochrome c oxidase assembly protein subunit 11
MMKFPSQKNNHRVLIALVLLVCGMIGLSFASVPLYRMFCQATGFGGTTQKAELLPEVILDRTVKVRFNADVSPGIPWRFKSEIQQMTLKLGQTGLMNYRVVNESSRPVIGTAVYNVTPDKAGLYFIKVQCFCFQEQILEAHQEVDMPVFFYIDPKMNDDPDMKDVHEIILSYSFFEANSKEYESAIDRYYKMIETISSSK